MTSLTLLQTRPQTLRRACQPRAARRHVVVLASKDAQLQQMREFKEEMSKKLQQVAEPSTGAGGRPVMAASVEQEAVTGLREIDSSTFYPTLEEAGDKLVVVDFYTAWCGPCKIIYPTLCEMAVEYADAGVDIVKFECKKENKELGQKLGIRVAPTFHLYKNNTKVAEMTGAKVDQLRELIEKHK